MKIYNVEKNQLHWSVRICLLLSFLLLIYLCGCESDRQDHLFSQEIKKKAIDACVERGGVPIIDGWGVMQDCKFPPCPEVKK